MATEVAVMDLVQHLIRERDEARAETARWVERVRVLEARLEAVRAAAQ